jgi:60kDa lysophospholipase
MEADESKVLVIYTGGTIGMMLGPSGYRPEPYFLTESLRSQARFHDPFEDSLFSHAGSSQGFREWSSHSSPSGTTSTTPTPEKAYPVNTLLVRSSRPIGTPVSSAAVGVTPSFSQLPTCRKVADDIYEAELPTLVTPRSGVHGSAGRRIRYAVLEVRASTLIYDVRCINMHASGIPC